MYELSPARFSKTLGGRRFEVLTSSSRLCFLVPWLQTPPAEAAGERTDFRTYAYERGSLWSLAEIKNKQPIRCLFFGGGGPFSDPTFFQLFFPGCNQRVRKYHSFFGGREICYGPFFVQAPFLHTHYNTSTREITVRCRLSIGACRFLPSCSE